MKAKATALAVASCVVTEGTTGRVRVHVSAPWVNPLLHPRRARRAATALAEHVAHVTAEVAPDVVIVSTPAHPIPFRRTRGA